MKHLYNRINKSELKKKVFSDDIHRTTLSFYKYHRIEDPAQSRDDLYRELDELGVLGRIYIATEGINGQISIPEDSLSRLKALTARMDFLTGCRLNIALEDDGKSFYKLTIKVRNKIVADGLDDANIDLQNSGKHLDAESFNQLSEEKNSIIVDMRNHYESEVGHFRGAITPDVETFKEALPVVETLLSDQKEKNILMYCTGGIRCEKASAYYKAKGFSNVYQLDGGIIEYARQVKSKGLENKFVGKNFVFDERLGERVSEEIIARCHQCGKPCDQHVNCANDACHILFIQCDECGTRYDSCCSRKCADFNKLEMDEKERLKGKLEFNGTKMGKGRYKAYRKDEPLIN